MKYLKKYEVLNNQGQLVYEYLYKASNIKIVRNHNGNLYTVSTIKELKPTIFSHNGTDSIGKVVSVLIEYEIKNDDDVLVGEDKEFRNISLEHSDKESYLRPKFSNSTVYLDDEESMSSFIYAPACVIISILSGFRKLAGYDVAPDFQKAGTFREYYKAYGNRIIKIFEESNTLGELYDKLKELRNDMTGRLDEFVERVKRTDRTKRFDL